jgi:hypothetical protein
LFLQVRGILRVNPDRQSFWIIIYKLCMVHGDSRS